MVDDDEGFAKDLLVDVGGDDAGEDGGGEVEQEHLGSGAHPTLGCKILTFI